jgi:hypothetical protein
MVLENQIDPARLALAELAQNCSHELSAFRARQSHGASYCFELLRRALADESQEAFACMFDLYQAQVARWVSSHRMFRASGEATPDVFVNEAFIRLHRQLRGARFDGFGSTEAVLSYLKSCAITALLEQNRKVRQQARETSLSDAIRDEQIDPSQGIVTGQLWASIERALPDLDDRLLIDMRFRMNMTPAEIASHRHQRYRDAREVSVALQRCLRRLSRHYELMELLS